MAVASGYQKINNPVVKCERDRDFEVRDFGVDRDVETASCVLLVRALYIRDNDVLRSTL